MTRAEQPDVAVDTHDPDLLNEHRSPCGRVRWQARRNPADRHRLIVVGVCAPSETPTVFDVLNERELRGLLEGPTATDTTAHWICARCNATNAADRRWCQTCSEAS